MAIVQTWLIVSVLFLPSVVFAVRKATGVPARDYFRAMWRPVGAAGAMALAIWAVNAGVSFTGAPRLALDVVVGACVYPAVLLGLWHISGRPAAAEQDILTLVQRASAKLARWRLSAQAAD